jgi:hypothetical protein
MKGIEPLRFIADRMISTRSMLWALLALGMPLATSPAWSQLVPGSMNFNWNEGAKDCKANPQEPIEARSYNRETLILSGKPLLHV